MTRPEFSWHSRYSPENGNKVQFRPTLPHAPGARIAVIFTNSLKLDSPPPPISFNLANSLLITSAAFKNEKNGKRYRNGESKVQ